MTYKFKSCEERESNDTYREEVIRTHVSLVALKLILAYYFKDCQLILYEFLSDNCSPLKQEKEGRRDRGTGVVRPLSTIYRPFKSYSHI